MVRPVRISSIARALPIARVRRCVPPAPGHDAELDLGLAELGVLAGDDHVARHRQLAAAAERKAADRGDERRPDRLDPVPRRERVVDEQLIRCLAASSLMSAPAANARVAGAGDDDRPAGVVGVEASSSSASSSSSVEVSAFGRLGGRA